MAQAVRAVSYINLVAYSALAIVAIRQWRMRRDPAAAWGALAFASLGIVVLLSPAIPDHPHNVVERALQRLDVAVLVLFPYLLFRFTIGFRSPSRRLALGLGSMTILLVVWTLALPRIPASGEPRPAWFDAWLAAFLVHWSILSVVSSVRLWRAGAGQPSVARRRMRLLAAAAAAITVAIIGAAASTGSDSPLALGVGLLATVSALAFLLGLSPPAILRFIWRAPEQRRLQQAIEGLMTLATSQEEIAARVLGPTRAIVGARAAEVRTVDGRVVGADGEPSPTDIRVEVPVAGGGALIVWTTPYAPFFGEEELRLLRTLGGLTGVALDRVRLFEQEREARIELERANELKENFVALAAHELRTPVTTIHGFARTLNHLGDSLDDAERRELREELERQTTRLASLVEQLLDLSRVDAERISISPERVNVRERVEELVSTAAGRYAKAVRVEVPPELEVNIDPVVLERVVGNLVANACRYGSPPVTVTAAQTDRHFRLAVEDRGGGVSPEFVPNLFERFTRSEASRVRAGGTGLGLAIARSYARAHGGDLLYENADPRGARFELVVPTAAVISRAHRPVGSGGDAGEARIS